LQKEGVARFFSDNPCECLAGGPVSRILYVPAQAGISTIYLGRLSPSGSSSLPVPIPSFPPDSRGPHDESKCNPGKAFTLIGTYLALQPIRFTRTPCHQSVPWALTPHFHPYRGFRGLASQNQGGYFLRHFLSIPAKAGISFPLGSMAPCVVPTFLPRSDRRRQSGPPAAAKIENKYMHCAPTGKPVGSGDG
jgi:hypothetical protein